MGLCSTTATSGRRLASFAAGALALALIPAPAHAQDWRDVVPGVELLERSTPEPQQIHALRVDLGRPEISLIATRPADKGTTVSQFAQSYGVAAAINGNYSNDVARQATGLAIGDGEVWGGLHSHPAPGGSVSLLLGRGDNQAAMEEVADLNAAPHPWVHNAVTGRPWLVRGGVVEGFECGEPPSPLICSRYARSAVGLSEDRGLLLLVVVDGISEQSVGMSVSELAALLSELGAHDAFALNYSNAATLWLGAEGGVVGCPGASGCAETPVMNHLGVLVDGTAVWYSAELVAQAPDPPDPIAPGASLERAVRYLNTGRATWSANSAHPVLLAPTTPRDRESAFYDPQTWRSATRAVAADGDILPGAEATFLLPLRGAGRPGAYTEAFAPVVLGAGPDGADLWLDEQTASWSLVVDGPADKDGDGHSEETDCDDEDPLAYPGAPERCNGVDDDCSGDIDDGVKAGRQAEIVWTARSAGTLRVNGLVVDSSDQWQQVRVVPVGLQAGANVVAVEAERAGVRGGVLVGVLLPDDEVLPSNSRWQVSTTPAEGWDTPDGDTSTFIDAGASAYFGQEPWEGALQGWPEELDGAGFIWIWSAQPDDDDTVSLRRLFHEPTDCPSPGVGVCARGAWRCEDGAVRCASLVRPGERSETCNGEDDDCDGLVDEGVAGCATAEDAGPPLPDLGTDLASAQLQVGLVPIDDPYEAMSGTGCGCHQRAAPSAWGPGAVAALAWLTLTLRRRRHYHHPTDPPTGGTP